jgi:hypothetical protein
MFASDIPEARRAALLEKIARRIVDLRLSTLAIVLLESVKPLSFFGSQAMIFLQPIFRAVFSYSEYDEIAALMEERSNLERLIQEIERLEDERGKRKDERRRT